MQCRNDQPNIDGFNFGVNNVFIESFANKANVAPIIPNRFLLLDGEDFLLLDGTDFLLLGT